MVSKLSEWLKTHNWIVNPFTFSIDSRILVGYERQKSDLVTFLESGHKVALLVGPTGSGKTSLLKWISDNSNGYKIIYVGKPPLKAEDFVDIMNDNFKRHWFLALFIPNIKHPYQIPEFLQKKKKRIVILFDEAHEAEIDVLEWLRVLSDQVENLSVIISALPAFEDLTKDKLETLRKRIITRIEVLSLTKEEMREMIKRRIESAGGSGIEPFDGPVIDLVYERTGGFPREVIRLCNDLVMKAVEQGAARITTEMLAAEAKKEETPITMIEHLTQMEKYVIELLGKNPMTPGEIANTLNLEKYKSRQHAVRSVNNIMKLMLNAGLLEREKRDKAFVYSLAPRIKTLVVKA